MSDRPPGSRAWWLETALIAGAGLWLAAWLWEGFGAGSGDGLPAAPAATARAPGLAEMIAAGCLTEENLAQLRDGQRIRVTCPAGALEQRP